MGAKDPIKLKSDKIPVLISYAMLRKNHSDELIDWMLSHPEIDVFIDSGAFTAYSIGETIKLRDYLNWIDKWGDKIWGYVALDEVGDPVRTEKNLEEMYRLGYRPAPVHVDGDSASRMRELFDMSPLVCHAGLPMSSRVTTRNKSYLKKKLEWADGGAVHWLGYTDEGMIQTFQPYSVDSSSWLSVGRYGSGMAYLGNGLRVPIRPHMLKERDLGKYERELFQMLDQLEIPRQHFFNLNNWTGWSLNNSVACLSVYSWVKYVQEIGERFKTRYFLATAGEDPTIMLYAAINRATGCDYDLRGRGQFDFTKTVVPKGSHSRVLKGKKRTAKRPLARKAKKTKIVKRRGMFDV